MRPAYQVQTISTFLKFLEHQNNVLTPVLNNINDVIKECSCWLTDTDTNTKSFIDMMQGLEETHMSSLRSYSSLLENQQDTTHSSGPANYMSGTLPSDSQNTGGSSKYVSIEEFQSLLHKLDVTDMTTGSLERKYLQIEENINTVNDKLTRSDGKLKSQAKKSKQQDRRIDDLEKNNGVLTEKIEEHSNAKRKLSDNMRQIMTTIQEINEARCDNKKHIEELSVVTKDLVKKTKDNETSVQDISESLSRTDNKLANGELKTGAMCQVLAKRFSQFESLQNVLSQLMKSREQNAVKLTKLNALETKCCRTSVGFCARIEHYLFREGEVIRAFIQVLCNTGGCFQPTTGEFTVPTDGLYCLSFNIDAVFKGEASIALYRKRLTAKTKKSETQEPKTPTNCTDKTSGYDRDNYTEDYISEVWIRGDITHGSCVTVLDLQEGDKLYLKLCLASTGVTLTDCSLFSCFRICS